jgi:Ni,Fe-hydrogenase III small subunit
VVLTVGALRHTAAALLPRLLRHAPAAVLCYAVYRCAVLRCVINPPVDDGCCLVDDVDPVYLDEVPHVVIRPEHLRLAALQHHGRNRSSSKPQKYKATQQCASLQLPHAYNPTNTYKEGDNS